MVGAFGCNPGSGLVASLVGCRKGADLLEKADVVAHTPLLRQLAVGDAEDCNRLYGHLFPRARSDTEGRLHVALVDTSEPSERDDLIALGNQVVQSVPEVS